MNVVRHETQLADDGVFFQSSPAPALDRSSPYFGLHLNQRHHSAHFDPRHPEVCQLSNPNFQQTNVPVSSHVPPLLPSAAASLAYLFKMAEPRQGLGRNVPIKGRRLLGRGHRAQFCGRSSSIDEWLLGLAQTRCWRLYFPFRWLTLRTYR